MPPSSLAAPRPPAQGLSSVEAQERLGQFGPNLLAGAARPHWLKPTASAARCHWHSPGLMC